MVTGTLHHVECVKRESTLNLSYKSLVWTSILVRILPTITDKHFCIIYSHLTLTWQFYIKVLHYCDSFKIIEKWKVLISKKSYVGGLKF